jgi:hypothetical protein
MLRLSYADRLIVQEQVSLGDLPVLSQRPATPAIGIPRLSCSPFIWYTHHLEG